MGRLWAAAEKAGVTPGALPEAERLALSPLFTTPRLMELDVDAAPVGGVRPRCHHPLRLNDRLYVSYWHHGFFILDVTDLSKPRLVSGLNSSPAHPHPTHTALAIPHKLKGRAIMVVADEDVAKLRPSPPSFSWIYDITDEMAARHPEIEPVLLGGERRFSRAHQVFINGARLAKGSEKDDDILQTPVGPDDTVSILTLITGG